MRNFIIAVVTAYFSAQLSGTEASAGRVEKDWKHITSIAEICDEYPERVEALFKALDLNIPGLQNVKQAYNSGNLPKACDELLEYYRTGNSGTWLRTKPITPGNDLDPKADTLCADTFSFYDQTATVPRLTNGHLNWDYRAQLMIRNGPGL